MDSIEALKEKYDRFAAEFREEFNQHVKTPKDGFEICILLEREFQDETKPGFDRLMYYAALVAVVGTMLENARREAP